MNRHAFAFAVTLFALAGPALADTPVGKFNRCISASPSADLSADCTAVRVRYMAQIQGCMAGSHDPSADDSKTAPSSSSHAYRARYLLCARAVKARHGPFGH